MRWRAPIVVAILMMAASAAPASAYTKFHSSLAFGLTRDRIDVEDGDSFDANGLFGMYRGYFDNGILCRFSISETHRRTTGTTDFGFGPLSGTVSDHFLRMEVSAGYLFRRKDVIRPFVHAGFARMSVEDVLAKVQLVRDDAMAPTYGAGVEVGKWHHAVYLDVNFDRRYKVDANFNLGAIRYTAREIQLGYLFSF